MFYRDPEPLHDGVIPSGGDSRVRIKNLEIIVDNMRQFYEEQLGHLLLTVPDILKLGKDPEHNVAEAKLLLLLLLGCAVQCSNKEDVITKIKTLHVDIQLAIVDCIKQVTDYQDIVVTHESMENVNMGNVFTKVKKLMQESNAYRLQLKSMQTMNNSSDCESHRDCAGNNSSVDDRHEEHSLLDSSNSERGDMSTPKKMNISSRSSQIGRFFSASNNLGSDNNTGREDVHRYAVELADWKSKVRKQRQELEEKTEALIECKEELDHNKTLLVKLKEENQELLLEARSAKSYRDELDAAIEKAEKADRLEAEVARYREKLTDIEYYKSRIDELREDNRVLMENKDMLEEQLNSARMRTEKVLELESEIIKYEKHLNEMTLERAADREKYQEVIEENTQLQLLIKSVASEVAGGAHSRAGISDSEADPSDTESVDNRLSEQLSNNAHARALKLELENRKLSSLVDSLKEQCFYESSSKMLEMENDKLELSVQLKSLREEHEKIKQEKGEVELSLRLSVEENKKLLICLAVQRSSLDKQQHDILSMKTKILELERRYDETMTKERQRLQALVESAEKRAEEAERSVASKDRELKNFKLLEEKRTRELKSKQTDLESKLSNLEKDRDTTHKELQKLRELVETKDVAIDEANNTIEMLEKKIVEFQQEMENSAAQICRLKEIERSSKELDSRAAIDREALENLQSNLVAERLNAQQIQTTLEKLGLDAETVLSQPADIVLDKISEIPDIINRVIQNHEKSNPVPHSSALIENKSVAQKGTSQEQENLQTKVLALQAASEVLLSEKAKLQVHVTRLESESATLSSQQAAVQLVNARLEAEMEQLRNERSNLQRIHADLGWDQKRLQTLHEQLNTEYECLSREKDSLKVSLRDSKNEARLLRESSERLEAKFHSLQSERDKLLENAKSLSNLRGEHSKLKEDFRNLFTNTETLKTQYRNLQDDYRKNKLENNRLSLRQTEMQGELSLKEDRLNTLELEIEKLKQQNEMLLQTNTSLDQDRRSLMDNISLLFGQYHELFSHSLQDKEHYHTEEKMFTDKVNNLYRQKEKLEEKIMEHYKKLESCSTKKKSLGASLVRRVRKAGSGLFNRNSRRASWSSANAHLNDMCFFPSDDKAFDDEDDDDNVEADLDEVVQRESNSSGEESAYLDPDALQPDDPLSLAHPGTRRTVYYTDDLSTPSLSRTTSQEKKTESDDPSMYQQQSSQQEAPFNDQRPVVVFNKISANINDTCTVTTTTTSKKNVDDSKNNEKDLDISNEKDRKAANSVWYEYGCV